MLVKVKIRTFDPQLALFFTNQFSQMKKATLLFLICSLFINCTQHPQQQAHPPAVDFEKEKAAIQAVIAKETESYYKQDFEAWKSTYLESPPFRKFGY